MVRPPSAANHDPLPQAASRQRQGSIAVSVFPITTIAPSPFVRRSFFSKGSARAGPFPTNPYFNGLSFANGPQNNDWGRSIFQPNGSWPPRHFGNSEHSCLPLQQRSPCLFLFPFFFPFSGLFLLFSFLPPYLKKLNNVRKLKPTN